MMVLEVISLITELRTLSSRVLKSFSKTRLEVCYCGDEVHPLIPLSPHTPRSCSQPEATPCTTELLPSLLRSPPAVLLSSRGICAPLCGTGPGSGLAGRPSPLLPHGSPRRRLRRFQPPPGEGRRRRRARPGGGAGRAGPGAGRAAGPGVAPPRPAGGPGRSVPRPAVPPPPARPPPRSPPPARSARWRQQPSAARRCPRSRRGGLGRHRWAPRRWRGAWRAPGGS